MVDIDKIQYTENSSNANSINKSEIIKQMTEKYDYSLPNQASGIPFNNKDVIARSKQVP